MGFNKSRKSKKRPQSSLASFDLTKEPFADSSTNDLRSRSAGVTPDSSPIARTFGIRRQISRSTGSRTSNKSNSLSSLSSDCVDAAIMDQEDIIQLTQEVRNFSDALVKLKNIFQPDGERSETPRVAAHERLRELLCILRNVLNKYPALHSTEIHTAAVILISQIKGFTNEYDRENHHTEFYDAIDQLALAFSSSVSEYLMGDLDQASAPYTSLNTSQSRSCDNLSSASLSSDGGSRDAMLDTREPACMSADEIDNTLLSLESGVDLGLVRAKAWSKYAKDVMTYVEKRVHIENEFAKTLAKLAHSTRPVLSEESYLPLQSIYCTALQQDMEYASNTDTTHNQVQVHKFLEPLTARRNEHDKKRKEIKHIWSRMKKDMADCKSNLDKAKQVYVLRQQDYEKSRDMLIKAEMEGTTSSSGLAKIEKRKKLEEDSQRKADEAETVYKSCVVEANNKQRELEDTKKKLVIQLRELIYQCDQTMKAVTVGYFQLMHSLSAPAPVQYQALCEHCRVYEPATQFSEFIRHQPVPSNKPYNPEPFTFEPYVSLAKESPRPSMFRKTSSQSTSSTGSGELTVPDDWLIQSSSKQTRGASSHGDGKGDKPRTPQPVHAWSHGGQTVSDSESGSSTRSQDGSPSASPRDIKRKLNTEGSNNTMSSGDEIGDEPQPTLNIDSRGLQLPSSGKFKNFPQSKAALTHVFRKLRAPSKCRECDSYVYFNGAECEHCGLSSHKKCLEYLAIQCGGKRLQGKMNVFGVHLKEHLRDTCKEVPFIVNKCISEINYRALSVTGLYRVAGVKAKVEKLCQTFENGADLVDLSDTPPHLVTSVLKLYLRQLPEPILTFNLYPEFVGIAKEHLNNCTEIDDERIVNLLKSTVSKLPEENFQTAALLMHHLKKVANHCERNKMPAANLGIVFGPTLLRQSEAAVTLSTLVEMPQQTRAIELLIHNSHIFGLPVEDLEPELDTSGGSQSSVLHLTEVDKKLLKRQLSNNSGTNSQSEDNNNTTSVRLQQPRLSLPDSSEDITALGVQDSVSEESLDGSTAHGNQADCESGDPSDDDDADVVIPVSTISRHRASAPPARNATTHAEGGATSLHHIKSAPVIRQPVFTETYTVPNVTSMKASHSPRSSHNTGRYTVSEAQAMTKPRASAVPYTIVSSNGNKSRLSTGSSVGSSLEDELSGSTGSLPGVCNTPPRTLPHPAAYSPSSSKREPKFV
ncbi:rho GTPase-activating protein 45-like isoform X2 [Glandiceps talaboti]